VASSIQYEIPTWSQIYDMLLCQAQKIHATYKPDVVVAVARGGLIPSRILTDLLECPQLATIQVEFYVDIAETKNEPALKQALTAQVSGKKVLLVDDIADTGKSLQLALRHLKEQGAQEVKAATIYYKPQSAFKPDFFENQTSNWVIFPWDTKETLRKIIQKQTGKRQINGEIAKIVKAGLPKQLAEKLLKDMQ
jgi:hypoxanthine phosphoribosyltransferase